MDTRSWRKVLLQWIGECHFIESNYITLEQSDLDSFFSVFIQKIQETENVKGKNELQDQPTEQSPLVQEFLAHNYPEFIAQQDDKEVDLPLDCLYVYTLLLHYSCVKKPSLFFHNICNKLPELTQTCIASFFRETVDRLLTREYLSQAIANVAVVYRQGVSTSVSPCLPSSSLSPDPRSDDAPCPSTPSSSSSQPSSSTPQLRNHREQLRLNGCEMPPPSTPKTELLEQRTKELRGIRTQLEVVRYEKALLEEQQMEKDELIKVLNKEKMMAKMELEKLRNVKLTEEHHDNESHHIMPYEFEHMKGCLLKEIGLKESLIAEITDKLHDLRVENSELSEKLNLAGKRLLEYTDRIRFLESRVDDLTRIVSSRDVMISSLESDKQELDKCLKEARDDLHNRIEVLNASSDLLDCSLSPNTTPENLASSVIDKQLREKEHENAELKEKLLNLNNSQRELCQALSSFLQKHNIDHEFPVEWTSSSLLSTISAIESKFVNTLEKSTQMKKECDVQSVCVEKLLEKCKLLSVSLGCQPKELDGFEATIPEAMESGFESSRECETILSCCHMKVVDIASKNNDLELDNERLNDKCAELKSIIDRGDQHLADINLQLIEKEKQIKDVGAEIQELRKRNINLENMLSQIADKEASAASHAQHLKQCGELLRAKYEVCRNELIAKNAAQDELVRMMMVPDGETLNGRVRQLIDLEMMHDEHNKMYAQMLKQLNELSAKHDNMTHSHLDFVKRTEIELETKNAQIMAFDEHNNHFDRFLTRIFTLLRSRNCPKSTTMGSATNFLESMHIEKRFENIEMLIEGQLLSADDLKRELDDLRSKNEELAKQNINGIIKRNKFITSLEVNTEKVKQYITDLEEEAFKRKQKVVQLENTLSKEQSNAKEMAQRLDIAQQEIKDYHVEAIRFINTIRDRLQQDFNGVNTPQQLGTCMTEFLKMYDQMEVRYEESSSLVEKLTESQAKLEMQVAELQVELENKDTNQHSGALIKQLNDTIQNLEKVNAKLSEDNTVSHTVHSKLNESLLKAQKELDLRAKIIENLEASERNLSMKLCELKDLKNKLKSSDEKIAQIKETYEEQIKALQAKCDMEAKKNEHLERNQNQSLTQLKEDALENCVLMSTKLEELQAKLQEGQQLVDSQKLELDMNRKELALVKSAYEAQTKLSDDLQRQKESGQQLVDNLKVELEKERKELAHVNSAIGAQTKLSDDLECQKESGQQLVDNLKVELEKERKELAQVKSVIEAQTKLSDDLQREKESAQQLVDNLKVELDKERKELAQVNSAFEAQTKLSDDLQRQKESAQQLVDNLKVELDKERKELAQVNSAFEAQTKLSDDLQREKESAQQLVDNLKVELDKERKELAQVKSVIEAQTKLSDDLQRQKESAQQLVDNLKVELDKERKELAKVKSVIEAQTKLSDDLQRQKESAQQLVDNLKMELDKERKELAQVKSAIGAQTKLSDDLECQKESVQQLVDNLKVELEKERKELAKVNSAFEAQTKLSDDLKLQKEDAQREVFLVKERLVKEKREFEVKLATLEDIIETLEMRCTQMEEERATAYEQINKLENRCQEKDNVKSSQLQVETFKVECLHHQLKSEMATHNSLVEDLNRKLAEKVSKLDFVQSRLMTEIAEHNQVKDQLAQITDIPKVVELQHRLEAETAEREEAQNKLAVVTGRLDEITRELDNARLEHGAQILRMEETAREVGNKNAELCELIEFYRNRVEALERLLLASNQELEELNSIQSNQAEGVRDLGDTYSAAEGRQTESDQDKERYQKLALDCKILQAKYRDAKDEIKRCEKKIKDQRLEMEGKLEKMKNKMRSLYTAEVTRMKEKQERDAAKSASELEALTAQNAKYEEHTRKLSNQIVRLNEKILEQQKQHAIISTNLRHLQMQPISETKPSSTTLTVSSSSSAPNDDWQPFKRPNVPSSNLAMEDEEGEVFNNTYLTDLKLGRVPADMTAEELIYRNSLQPPHLKSTYAAQYDLGSQDEDLKDGPHSLDDSMSALLSSSSTGTRKKSMGTHYKRPGPPTPSKNGGRLSFGSSEPPREILREFGDHNNTSKTPARFKFLTQRFSVGSSGLPRDELPRRKRPNLLTGIHRRRLRHAVDIFCTSTPRKSRSYYDQQRMIGASDADKSEAVETEDEVIEVEPDAVPELEPLEDADQQGTPHLSTAALLALTKGNTRRLTGTTKSKKGRVSLSLHGNIFAKSRPASFVAGKRVQLRRKLRRDRIMGRFDEARHLDQMRLSHSAQAAKSPENNNYSLHNRNEEEHLPSENNVMGKTVVLVGKRRLSPVVSTTFNVEERSETSLLQQQFEHENCVTWAMHGGESVMMEETQNDWYFEQLCKETESTAPFQLQPLDYKPLDEEQVEPKFTQLVAASCSNITTTSCATNMTGASSCTVYSIGSVHMQPLPQINITYVQQPSDLQQRRPTRHRSLMAQCRRFLRHLSLGQRLVMGFALLVMVGLSLHLADKLVLVITGILSGMGLVFLTYSCPGRN
uniref:Mushroom body defect, isoform L n=1 Tax=Drosophila melanogaster TaxID=7227 RepID=M9PEK6_DROME|nr:mushroom body defect, isoform L [Drosophila melanogaster]AGB95387.1 mushroom body defect, isoform L [Drosophila melanogaster]|eukprot:NP_001259545.1 mushroom body defect, isoform L [Drosophila melanogaster]